MVYEATGQPKVTEATTLEEILKFLEGLYLEAKPFWVQRTNCFKEVQCPGENFKDLWSQKIVLKEAYQALKGITAHDLNVLEVLRGVRSNKLRKELLKVRNPKSPELFQIARNWQHGKEWTSYSKPQLGVQRGARRPH